MNNVMPRPRPGPTGIDPLVLTAAVETALTTLEVIDEAAEQLQQLDSLHQQLVVALATIDGA